MPYFYYNLLFSVMLCAAVAVPTAFASAVRGVIGLPITLPCSYNIHTHSKTSMYWAKKQCASFYVDSKASFIETDGDRVTFTSSSRYTMTGDIPNGDVSLTINELVEGDEGNYCCRVEIPGWFNDLLTSVTLKVEKDRDECLESSNICGSYSVCSNTIGSYKCTCQKGFKSKSGMEIFVDTSSSGCIDRDECLESSNICGSYSVCSNTVGSYKCTCQKGFKSKSGMEIFVDTSSSGCIDDNECRANNTCPSNAECHNTIGSYYCLCNSGFRTRTGTDNLNSTQETCQGQSCHCCHESQNISHPQCRPKLILVKSQRIVEKISSAERNSTTAKQHKEEQLTSLLQDMEKSVLDDVLSSMISNGTQEEIIRHYTKAAEIVARSVPVNSVRFNETVTLMTGTATMAIRTQTLLERAEQGIPPVAVLISFNGYDIESVLSSGCVDGKEERNTMYKLNSKIITATISSKSKNNFSQPVIFTFLKNKIKADMETSTCVFWKTDDKNTSYWSTEGCFVSNEGTNSTHVTCKCNHLSSFAVLLAHIDINERPLSIISYIGLSLSVICLLLSVLTFWRCHSIKNASTALLLNLCICLLVADVIFLFGITKAKYQILCRVIAAFLHYFLLACFSWMCLGALQLHLMVQNIKEVKAFRTHIIRMKYMYLVGYGAPVIIVTISAAVFPDGYGTDKLCWLSLDRGFRWSFIGPVCFAIMINIILFAITIHMLRDKFSALNKNVSTIKNTKVLLFKAAAQFLVLGCTWIFGIFHFQKETLVMSYIFTVLNSFHGVFMFLLYCAANKLVMDEYKIWIRRFFRIKKKEKELSTTTTTTTTGISATLLSSSSPSTTGNEYNLQWIKEEPSTVSKNDEYGNKRVGDNCVYENF